MKHPEDQQTVDWCEEANKPKFIETELGREKLCKHCQEYWPVDSEFWYMIKDTLKDGTVVQRPDSACKGCYDKVYRPNRAKRKNNIEEVIQHDTNSHPNPCSIAEPSDEESATRLRTVLCQASEVCTRKWFRASLNR